MKETMRLPGWVSGIPPKSRVLYELKSWVCGHCSKGGPEVLATLSPYEDSTYTCPKCDRQFIVRLVE